MNDLPINLDDLVNARSVESSRVELKATWSDPIARAVLHTICAFANDLLNQNGGYIVLGVEEVDGRPVLPPRGLGQMSLDEIQKKIRGQCQRIDPIYVPLLYPAELQDQPVLVIWAPGGDNRPYQAPKTVEGGDRAFYVRQGPETVDARGDVLRQLLEQTAKIPFDDRRSLAHGVDELSPALVRRFLADVRSDLVVGRDRYDEPELYRKLRIVAPVNAHEVPKNVGLLFFHEDPDAVFPGARIEVVQFADGAGGNLVEERVVRGPLPQQIRVTLEHLGSLADVLVKKSSHQAEAARTVAYPYEAMEEALVNAVYHRSYDGVSEPTKIYLYPDRMEIISYPGPVPGIRLEDLEPGRGVPPVPARNRRIGDFLKELRLAEGRGTGLPKISRSMQENGSPLPRFDFDEARTFFRATLPAHPGYQILHALRESAQLWAVGDRLPALRHLERALERQPGSGVLAAQLVDYAMDLDDVARAQAALARFESEPDKTAPLRPATRMAMRLLDIGAQAEARKLLDQIAVHETLAAEVDLADLAILRKRAGDYREAHRLFERAYEANKDDARFVHELAQTKMKLAEEAQRQGRRGRINPSPQLYADAERLLRRALSLADQPMRQAWCWVDLAKVLSKAGAPVAEIDAAYGKAIELLPSEARFRSWYASWKAWESRRRR